MADEAERCLRSLAPDLESSTITGDYVGDPLLLGYAVSGVKCAEELHGAGSTTRPTETPTEAAVRGRPVGTASHPGDRP